MSLKVIEILFFDVITHRTKGNISSEDKVFAVALNEVCINFNEFAKFIIKYVI